MVLITIVTGVYKPTYNWGAPHCRNSRRFNMLLPSTVGSSGLFCFFIGMICRKICKVQTMILPWNKNMILKIGPTIRWYLKFLYVSLLYIYIYIFRVYYNLEDPPQKSWGLQRFLGDPLDPSSQSVNGFFADRQALADRFALVAIQTLSCSHEKNLIPVDGFGVWWFLPFAKFADQENIIKPPSQTTSRALIWQSEATRSLPPPDLGKSSASSCCWFSTSKMIRRGWASEIRITSWKRGDNYPIIYIGFQPSFWWCRISLAHPRRMFHFEGWTWLQNNCKTIEPLTNAKTVQYTL